MKKNVMDKAGFFGKVTASVTHELQNVLAIIRENSGLMEDILLMEGGGSELGERLHKSLNTVKNQVDRGVNLTSGLNHFAHTTDHAELQVNAIELIQKLISLTGRLTKLKGVDVSISECEKQPNLQTDPVLFQQIAFLCIDCLVNIVPAETKLLISCADKGDALCIQFMCSHSTLNVNDLQASIADSLIWNEITLVSRQLNAKAELEENSLGISLAFTCSPSLEYCNIRARP